MRIRSNVRRSFVSPVNRWIPLVVASLACIHLSTYAASIPGLYNTGVDDTGTLLSSNVVDSHYRLTASADTNYPGPDVYTLSPGFPVGPWLAEGPNSRWIAPRQEQGTGNTEGDYTYTTTFDLTDLDHTTARILGKWAVDNGGTDIRLNGVSLGLANTGGFGGFTPFVISNGFVAGVNTLEFIVNNAAPPGPTGLRLEMASGVVELEGPPYIMVPPTGAAVLEGSNVTFTVEATGEFLDYQWRKDGVALSGQNAATLTLNVLTTNDAGQYDVVVSNPFGQTNSPAATLSVLVPISGLFDTGVGEDRVVLADNAVDPHYKLVNNPDGGSTDAIVQNSTAFPIVSGPWLANNAQSKWIGPRLFTEQAGGGEYRYRVIFDLTGLDPTTAFVAGGWTSDNPGLDILVNGVSTGVAQGGNFDTLFSFNITTGFISGTNTIDFIVRNDALGYTGLRVQGLYGGAQRLGSEAQPPRIVGQPQSQIAFAGGDATLTVVADGTAPLNYQWFFAGSPIANATNAALQLTGLALSQSGAYRVTVSNVAGTTNSADATLTILAQILDLYSTGVDDTGALLPAGTPDPHYFLLASPDTNFPGPAAVTLTAGPIPPWVAEGPNSRWIAPQSDQNAGNPLGIYAYGTTFTLFGSDPTTAVIEGSWAADDQVMDVLLNGVSLGLANGAGFSSMIPFQINKGFVAGTNTLVFLVHNGGASANPTGLRIDMRGGRLPATCLWPSQPALRIAPGQTNQTISFLLPPGLTDTQSTTVKITSSNPDVALPAGAVGSELTLTYPVGSPFAQEIPVLAKAAGTAVFTMTASPELCIGTNVTVAVGETLIANASFENNFNAGFPHYSAIDQWRQIPTGGPGVNEADGPFHDNGVIPDRGRVAFFQNSGGLYQVLSGLVRGQSYWLQFRYNERQNDGGPISLKVRVNGRTITDLPDIAPVGAGNSYYSSTVPFVASSETVLLEFATSSSGDASLLLDAVSVVPRLADEAVIINPSFESSGWPAFPGYVSPGPLNGWAGTGSYGVNRSGEGPFADNGIAPDQRGVLFLQNSGSSVSQQINNLFPGTRYALSFAYNTRSGNSPHLRVTIDGSSVFEADVVPVGGSAPYHQQTILFVPTNTTAVLAFAQTTEGDHAVLLDDVRLVPQLTPRVSFPSAGVFRVSWPHWAAGYRLEFATELPGNFIDPGLPVISEGNEVYIEDVMDSPAKFYRLMKP